MKRDTSNRYMSDEREILAMFARYCRGIDRLDEELVRSCYHDDSTDDHGVYTGPAWPFVEHCMVSHLKWRSTAHCIFNHTIDLAEDGTHARGEIYNVTYLFQADADVLDTWHGRYLDLYEKRDGEWRIKERVCVHEGTHSEPVAAMDIDAPSFRQGDFDRPSSNRPLGP